MGNFIISLSNEYVDELIRKPTQIIYQAINEFVMVDQQTIYSMKIMS